MGTARAPVALSAVSWPACNESVSKPYWRLLLSAIVVSAPLDITGRPQGSPLHFECFGHLMPFFEEGVVTVRGVEFDVGCVATDSPHSFGQPAYMRCWEEEV